MGAPAPERSRIRVVLERAREDGTYERRAIVDLDLESAGAAGFLFAAVSTAVEEGRVSPRTFIDLAAIFLEIDLDEARRLSGAELEGLLLERIFDGAAINALSAGGAPVH